MQGAYVESGVRERAINLARAALELGPLDFDVPAHAAPVAQLRRSCSNEPQHFCAAYRKTWGATDLVYIDAECHTGRSPDLSGTGDLFDRMREFVGKHVR